MEKIKCGNKGDPGKASSCAERARVASAGSYPGGMPPSGPKKEPVRLNGVPTVGSKNGGLKGERSK